LNNGVLLARKLRADAVLAVRGGGHSDMGAGQRQVLETKNPVPMVRPLALRMRRVDGSICVMLVACSVSPKWDRDSSLQQNQGFGSLVGGNLAISL
jgi:hypothetical protein